MKLIIDKFEIPGHFIAEQIFKTKGVFTPIDLQNLDPNLVYCLHEESKYLREKKWYFNEIVEIKNNLVYLNKKRKIVKYFNIIKENGKYIFKEIVHNFQCIDILNKNDYLPHLKAQDNEVVIFPTEEEDDEV